MHHASSVPRGLGGSQGVTNAVWEVATPCETTCWTGYLACNLIECRSVQSSLVDQGINCNRNGQKMLESLLREFLVYLFEGGIACKFREFRLFMGIDINFNEDMDFLQYPTPSS